MFMKPDKEIRAFLEQNFECEIHEGNWGDPFPNFRWNYIQDENGEYFLNNDPEYDWIFSWLCPWKIPKEVLKSAKKGAINFHPGPPKYPGIGCYNYAIWNEDKEYGVTCHFMDEKLDSGEIIESRLVRMYKTDTIQTLKNRSIIALKSLFYAQMDEILTTGNVHIIHDALKWGKYKSRKDFQEFCNADHIFGIISDYFTDGGIEWKKWLRATYFKGARDLPYIEVNGKKWCLIPKTDL